MNHKLTIISVIGTALAAIGAYKLYCVLSGGHEDMRTNEDRGMSVTCFRCGRKTQGINVW